MGRFWGDDYGFQANDRVAVRALALYRHTGTLIRPTRLAWNGQKAWLVQLDDPKAPGGSRQRIGEVALVPIAQLETACPLTWKAFLPWKRS